MSQKNLARLRSWTFTCAFYLFKCEGRSQTSREPRWRSFNNRRNELHRRKADASISRLVSLWPLRISGMIVGSSNQDIHHASLGVLFVSSIFSSENRFIDPLPKTYMTNNIFDWPGPPCFASWKSRAAFKTAVGKTTKMGVYFDFPGHCLAFWETPILHASPAVLWWTALGRFYFLFLLRAGVKKSCCFPFDSFIRNWGNKKENGRMSWMV